MPDQSKDQNTFVPKKGGLEKRSMRIAGRRTSLALEAEFWEAFEKLARNEGKTLPVLTQIIDTARKREWGETRSLASAVRTYVLVASRCSHT